MKTRPHILLFNPDQWRNDVMGHLGNPAAKTPNIDALPYHSKAAMCRTQDFKYVKRLYEEDELYDLKNDPGEIRNVIEDPAYASVLLELKERLLSWYMESCDVVPRLTDKR